MQNIAGFDLSILWMLIGVLVGFVAGQFRGFSLGRRHGKAEQLVALRQINLMRGRCVLCDEEQEIPAPTAKQLSSCREEVPEFLR